MKKIMVCAHDIRPHDRIKIGRLSVEVVVVKSNELGGVVIKCRLFHFGPSDITLVLPKNWAFLVRRP